MPDYRPLTAALATYFYAGSLEVDRYRQVEAEYRNLIRNCNSSFDGFRLFDTGLLTQLIQAAMMHQIKLQEHYFLRGDSYVYPHYQFWEEIGANNADLSNMRAARRYQAREALRANQLPMFQAAFATGLQYARETTESANERADAYCRVVDSLPPNMCEIVGRMAVERKTPRDARMGVRSVGVQRDLIFCYSPDVPKQDYNDFTEPLPHAISFATKTALKKIVSPQHATNFSIKLGHVRMFKLDYSDNHNENVEGNSWHLGAVLALIYFGLVDQHYPGHVTEIRPLFVPWIGTGIIGTDNTTITAVGFLFQKMWACVHNSIVDREGNITHKTLTQVMFPDANREEFLNAVLPGSTMISRQPRLPIPVSVEPHIHYKGKDFYPVQDMTTVGAIASRVFKRDHSQTTEVVFLAFTKDATLNDVTVEVEFDHNNDDHEKEVWAFIPPENRPPTSYPTKIITTRRGSKKLTIKWSDRTKEISLNANSDKKLCLSYTPHTIVCKVV